MNATLNVTNQSPKSPLTLLAETWDELDFAVAITDWNDILSGPMGQPVED